MPKIRGVKPELWTDENFVELSPFARLLWMGMWNFACDNGHIQDKSKQIKLRVLPTDDVNCAELLRELEHQRLIERADGWITIPNLSHHQKPHKRWWTTCDKPGCELPEGTSHAPANRGTTVAPPKSHRGTTADGDCEGDVDGDVEVKVTGKASSDESDNTPPPDRFDEWWDTYGNKIGRKKCEIAYRAALKKPGVTADLLIASTAAYVLWCRESDTFLKHPLTWLHGEHWTDERPARPAPQSRVQQHLQLARDLQAEEQGQMIPFPQIGGDR